MSMDLCLLCYYNCELQYVCEMGGEFVCEYFKIVGWLGLEGFECVDLYVECLLEGFVFFVVCVQFKFDVQYLVFIQYLLEMVYLYYFVLVLLMVVVQLQFDLKEVVLVVGYMVLWYIVLCSQIGCDDCIVCEYCIVYDVMLWLLELVEVKYFEMFVVLVVVGVFMFDGKVVWVGLWLKFCVMVGVLVYVLVLDKLLIFIVGVDELFKCLYEQLLGNVVGYVVWVLGLFGGMFVIMFLVDVIYICGFDDSEVLIFYMVWFFSGYWLLQEYFVCFECFLFVEFIGLCLVLVCLQGNEFEIDVLFDCSIVCLYNVVDVGNFWLFCMFVINLFQCCVDCIYLQVGKIEYYVLVDCIWLMDFEIYLISEVEGFGDWQELELCFQLFYGCDECIWYSCMVVFYMVCCELCLFLVC